MCDSDTQQANALITSQNHGTILVMVAWFLACLVVRCWICLNISHTNEYAQALCTAGRVVTRCRSRHHSLLPLSDDAIVATASLCALGSTLVLSTAVDSGLGKRECLLFPTDVEQVQIKIFIATILFVMAISVSKCSILLFLYRLARDSLQKAGVVMIGALVLLWTIAVISGTVFQCEMPQPWTIWTGKCIPLVRLSSP